jgi:hypothetical protein
VNYASEVRSFMLSGNTGKKFIYYTKGKDGENEKI